MKDIGGLLALIAEALRGDGPTLDVTAREACDCGCDAPAGIEFKVSDRSVRVTSPDTVDLLVDGLAEMRAKLWGPRQEATARGPRKTVHDEEGAADARRN